VIRPQGWTQLRHLIIEKNPDGGGRVPENHGLIPFAHHWNSQTRACRFPPQDQGLGCDLGPPHWGVGIRSLPGLSEIPSILDTGPKAWYQEYCERVERRDS